jgi:hypothetical protein
MSAQKIINRMDRIYRIKTKTNPQIFILSILYILLNGSVGFCIPFAAG